MGEVGVLVGEVDVLLGEVNVLVGAECEGQLLLKLPPAEKCGN